MFLTLQGVKTLFFIFQYCAAEVKILCQIFFFSIIHLFFFTAASPALGVVVGVDPVPAVLGRRRCYTLDKSAVNSRANRKTTNNHLQSFPSIHTHTHTRHRTCTHANTTQQSSRPGFVPFIHSFIYLFPSPQKIDSHFGRSEANTLTVRAFHHVHREAFKAHADQMRTFPQKICRGRAPR